MLLALIASSVMPRAVHSSTALARSGSGKPVERIGLGPLLDLGAHPAVPLDRATELAGEGGVDPHQPAHNIEFSQQPHHQIGMIWPDQIIAGVGFLPHLDSALIG
ncbi:hypothetical protein [Bradyrhizobium elkanii]|uniref:hypothetical protein n=1 Tax=Bradyrhizobium elkanii TaxID=29448 RepID=UPI00056DEBBF|nr:hypothetical protein [Bradyrhizobium elkanii]WLA79526.1 hypothetical protein QNJ99_29505 [Bradyrhizobium elkanii]